MAQAGYASIETAKQNGSWTLLDDVEELKIPTDLQIAFNANKGAKEYFLALSKSVKKMMLQWVMLAKRPETRQNRINEIAELAAEKPVLIRDISISGTQYKVYLSSTRSNQLLISVYDPATGELVEKKYLGKNSPITACDLIQTEDEGLNILVQVKIMGNLDRIGLIKLSKAEAEAIVD